MTSSRQIAQTLGLHHQGPDVELSGPASVGSARPGTLLFVSDGRDDLVPPVVAAATEGPLAVIATEAFGPVEGIAHIVSPRPRLDFARALSAHFDEAPEPGVHPSAVVHPTASVHATATVEPHAVIGAEVTIGPHSRIGAGTVIERRCRIGERTVIKANTVIGGPGFGFEYDEEDRPVRLPHLGAVTIGDNTEIGAVVSIARGTLDDTVIGDHVKIDDHVFIAHNVHVGDGSFVIAGAEVSGSVVLGRGAWIGPQVTIRDQVVVGENAMAGIGAVVTKNVEAGMIVAGNPARPLRARDLSRDR